MDLRSIRFIKLDIIIIMQVSASIFYNSIVVLCHSCCRSYDCVFMISLGSFICVVAMPLPNGRMCLSILDNSKLFIFISIELSHLTTHEQVNLTTRKSLFLTAKL